MLPIRKLSAIAACCAAASVLGACAAGSGANASSAAASTAVAAVAGTSTATAPPDGPAYGPELQGFDYPHPVHDFSFTSQGQTLHMAYMDVQPEKPNGRTAVLLHGKNFCSATWGETITRLTDAGYRVIAPDQIGFCK